MPWTLYTYILRELVRLLALAAAVLVVLISFAAATKPLSDGLLGPWTLLKFILYSIPTTLTVVMPFAGAFASTLVFSRMASDNEISACATSGISYRSVLLPVFALGWLVAVALYLLSNWMVPWFFRQTALMLERDVMSLVVSQVRAGRPVALPGRRGYVLYANDAEEREPPVAEGDVVAAQRLIMLRGVAIGVFDRAEQLRDLYTAEKADVYVFREGDRTRASMRLRNVLLYDPATGTYAASRDMPVLPIDLPSPIGDDLRFFSWVQLRELSRQPQRFDRVRRRHRQLAARVAGSRLEALINDGLAGGAAAVHLLSGGGDRLEVRCPRVERVASGLELVGSADAPVRVRHVIDGAPSAEIESPLAVLEIELDETMVEPRLTLELETARVRDLRPGDRVSEKRKLVFRRLRWPEPLVGPLHDMTPGALSREAERWFPGDAAVNRAHRQLGQMIVKIRHKIFARVHERAALAVASLLVLLFGAVLSVRLAHSMPLVVYFWSFLLALTAVLITRSSENIASDPAYPPALGLAMVWSGNLLLLVAIAVVYRRLARN